jgi:pimeloyl-ACP methyl ester carboxylesterase
MFFTKQQSALLLDKEFLLDIQGTRQAVRLRAKRLGLPPLLIVQAGPGLPVLNEVDRWANLLAFEEDFTVAYWEQRGCGVAPSKDAQTVSLASQEKDLVFVVDWLSKQTGNKVSILGISIGATIALKAAGQEFLPIKTVIAVSPDTDVSMGDKAAQQSILFAAQNQKRPRHSRILKLGPPPYLDPRSFQNRARLLADLGSIEHASHFAGMLRVLLSSLIKTYGLFRIPLVLSNMTTVQEHLLNELSQVNILINWPTTRIPVHYVFGAKDLLIPESLVKEVQSLLGPEDTLVTLPQAGHLVHFDQPVLVRQIVKGTLNRHEKTFLAPVNPAPYH